MTDEIFLSYARSDRKRAEIFAKALEKQGYSIWWDRSIPHGRKFDEYILEKINQAKCIIVLWSRDSVKSDWVMDEAERGKRRGILIPVLIDDVDIPLGFGRYQTAQLIDWAGALPNEEFGLLTDSIAGILGRTQVQEKKIQEPEEEKRRRRQKEDDREKIKKKEETVKTITSSIGMKFTLIPAGEFDTGSPPDEEGRLDNESPVHHVKISKPFYLGIHPVTQKEWKAVMGNNPSHFKGDDLPVEQVSWNDVQEFIKNLNKKENTNKYRLPSEAEWEYAARAGTKSRYFFGDDDSELGEYAWYAENSGSRPPKKGDYFGYDQKDWTENKWNGKTHPVGQKKPNKWGLYDMHGNVWEWVQDVYHDNYKGAPDDGSAWEGDGSDRVARGGGWYGSARNCRSANRNGGDPGDRRGVLGFRLLRDL